ncbi:MAG: PLD nuclease N-terminal domain-containing protein [Micromonosporaceae bacterium]
MGRVLLLLILINLALVFAAIVDCLGGERKPARWSRFAWSLVIVFGFLIGPLAWFMYGRPGRKLAAPWDRLLPGPGSQPPLAPDDDPDFLADLERRRTQKPEQGPEQTPPRQPPSPSDESSQDTSGKDVRHTDPSSDKRKGPAPDEPDNGPA